MSSDNTPLEAYLERIYQERFGLNKQQRPLTDDELKEIALTMGMTERDWADMQRRVEEQYARAQVFVKGNNEEDALPELESAVALNPNHVGVLILLATVLERLSWQEKDPDRLNRAEKFLDRALQLDSVNAEALRLKNVWEQNEKRAARQKKNRVKTGLKWGGALLLLLLLGWWFFSSRLAGAEQLVNQNQAQLNNVLNRKKALIPGAQDPLLQPLLAARLTPGELSTFQHLADSIRSLPPDLSVAEMESANQRMTQLLQQMMAAGTEALEIQMDLRVQIEGAENRVRVEAKRYNEAAAAYNARCQSWPYSWMGGDPVPFFIGETTSNEP